MDIFEQWHKIEREKFNNQTIKREDIMDAIYQKSKGTIETLKNRLKYKMNWVLFFMICFISLMIWQYNNLPALLIFAGMLTIYTLGYFGLRRRYKEMGTDLKDGTSLEVMKSNYKTIVDALNFEMNASLPILPIMLLGGLILPALIKGESILQVFSEPKILIFGIIALLVLVPFTYFIAKKANDYAYGEFIQKLEHNIKEMERVG